jgi:putative transcriptional regulator
MAIRVRLRELLAKRAMAQTELQLRSGLGYSTINALYHEKTQRIEFATIEKLCEVLGCGVGDVLVHEQDAQVERRR